MLLLRAVGRSENPGVPVLFGGHNLLPLVEIGLTDLPKSGGAPPGTTELNFHDKHSMIRREFLKMLNLQSFLL